MTWFKVDDSFYDHPKVFDASDAAIALWTRAGSWAARNLTDGFVPHGLLARLSTNAEAASKELLDRGLWQRMRGGYLFHDWAEYQPTREKVIHNRKQTAARQAAMRERKKKPSSEDNPSRRDSRVSHTSSHAVSHTTPTRPDPPPKGGEGRGVAANSSPPGQCRRHRGQPADNCAMCRSEAIAAREDEA